MGTKRVLCLLVLVGVSTREAFLQNDGKEVPLGRRSAARAPTRWPRGSLSSHWFERGGGAPQGPHRAMRVKRVFSVSTPLIRDAWFS